MQVVTIETPALGDRSYLIHDGAVGAVIDPQRDTDRILDAATEAGVRITHVFETHLHNDYVSGGLVLARTTGSKLHHAKNEDLSFDHVAVEDGDTISVGDLTVEAVATPGHTPHHLAYIACHGDTPPAVFTGGSLLYGTVGRTDLISTDRTDELTRAQYRSARRIAEGLPDDAEVHPTHGFGSFCSSATSDGESDGKLGTERQVNLALTNDDEDDFVARLLDGLTSFPSYYAHMSHLNRAGAGPADLTRPQPLDPYELECRVHRGEWIVDMRDRRAFAAEHLRGTIGIEFGDQFSTYVGWLIPWAMPITLLGETPEQITEAQRQLVRVGIDRPSGAASGGLRSWPEEFGRRAYRAISFAEAADHDGKILDVRRDDERRQCHIAGSLHIPLEDLDDRAAELPRTTLAVHCASGYRASIAASLLDRAGHSVVLIDDAFDCAGDSHQMVEG